MRAISPLGLFSSKSIFTRTLSGGIILALISGTILPSVAQAGFWEERRQTTGAGRQDGPVRLAQAPLSQVLPVGEKVLHGYNAGLKSLYEENVPARTTTQKDLPGWMKGLVTPFGQVEDFSLATGFDPLKSPFIVLLQDVHDHLEAQQNLAKLLETYQGSFDLRLVGLEGARGGFMLDRFRALTDKDALNKAGDYLLENKIIGGPEYFGLTAAAPSSFWGVETEPSYLANIQAYKDTAPFREAAKAYRSALDQKLSAVKTQVFNDELKTLDAASEAYAKDSLPLDAYLSRLADAAGAEEVRRFPNIRLFLKAAALEKTVDFDRAQAERDKTIKALAARLSASEVQGLVSLSLEARLKRISLGDYFARLELVLSHHSLSLRSTPSLAAYVDYARLADALRKDLLFDEITALEEAAGRRLAITAEQREVLSMAADARLLSKLLSHSLTTDEWGRYGSRREAVGRLNDRLGLMGAPSLPAFPGALADYEAFYRHAHDRNVDLLGNLLSRLDVVSKGSSREKPALAVLVAGGFHTAGIRDLMTRRGLSHAVVTPTLTRVDGIENALDVFVRPPTDLERAFSGEKVFLNKPRPSAENPTTGFGHMTMVFVGVLLSVYLAVQAARGVVKTGVLTLVAQEATVETIEKLPQGVVKVGVKVGDAAPVTAMVTADEKVSLTPAPRSGIFRIARNTLAIILGLGVFAPAFAQNIIQGVAQTSPVISLFGVLSFGLVTSVTLYLYKKTLNGKSSSFQEIVARPASDLPSAVRKLEDLSRHYGNSRADMDRWAQELPGVTNTVKEFLPFAEGVASTEPFNEVQALQVLKGIQFLTALPQMSGVVPGEEATHVRELQKRLTDVWLALGRRQEVPRVDAIQGALKDVPEAEKRMKKAHVIFKDGEALIEDLPAKDWAPYKDGQKEKYWAPYLSPATLKTLLEKLPLTAEDGGAVSVSPGAVALDLEKLKGAALKGFSAEDAASPLKRLNAVVDFEGKINKDPEKALALAESLGIAIAPEGTSFDKASENFGVFMRDFSVAMSTLKRVENWAAKRESFLAGHGDLIRRVRSQLGLTVISEETVAVRLAALNIPLEVVSAALDSREDGEAESRAFGAGLILRGLAGKVLMAGGAASRWKSSLEALIRRKVVDGAKVPENLPRALAAPWDRNDVTGLTGVRLTHDSEVLGGSSKKVSYVLSPFTWVDFAKDFWRRMAEGKSALSMSVIAQNAGEAVVVGKDGVPTGERLPGKVLGHGNVRGWGLGVLESLKQGKVFDVLHSADNPFAQLSMPQFQEIVGRMAQEGLSHVGMGNWRNIGQSGGGYADVNGVPDIMDTAIPKEDNGKGYAANRDINLFATFVNVVNNASLLYAVSDGVVVNGKPLMSWEDVLDVSRGSRRASLRLAKRLAALTPEQEALIVSNFMALLPSEYVEKEEGGKKIIQWEQISGMLHGALPRAIHARMEKEGVMDDRPLSLAYADMSLSEYQLLGDKADEGGYTPTFLEVKTGGDLLKQQSPAREIIGKLSDKGIFSSAVKEALSDSSPLEMVPEEDLSAKIAFGTSGWRALVAPAAVADGGFTRGNAGRFAQAFADTIKEEAVKAGKSNPKVAVGYDARAGGREFAVLLVEVLVANGIQADLNDQVAPTPVLAEATRPGGGYDYALVLTASHNPVFEVRSGKEYNWLGIKAMTGGTPAPDALTQSVAQKANFLTAYHRTPYAEIPASLSARGVDLIAGSNARLGKVFDLKAIGEKLKAAGRTFVMTSMFGGTVTAAQVLNETEVVRAHLETDPLSAGTHPRTVMDPKTKKTVIYGPDPSNPLFLHASMKTLDGREILLAFDGDGDRLVVVEDGKVVSPNDLGLIFAEYLHSKGERGSIVRTLPTSRAYDRFAKRKGLKLVSTPVGSKNFDAYKNELMVGVEESGHVFFRYKGELFADSAVAEAALVMEILAERGSLWGALKETQDHVGQGRLAYERTAFQVKDSLVQPILALRDRADEVGDLLMARLAAKGVRGKLSKVDAKTDKNGIYFELADGSWVMFRKSGTEPKFRVYAESDTRDVAGLLAAELEALVKDMVSGPTLGARAFSLAKSVGSLLAGPALLGGLLLLLRPQSTFEALVLLVIVAAGDVLVRSRGWSGFLRLFRPAFLRKPIVDARPVPETFAPKIPADSREMINRISNKILPVTHQMAWVANDAGQVGDLRANDWTTNDDVMKLIALFAGEELGLNPADYPALDAAAFRTSQELVDAARALHARNPQALGDYFGNYVASQMSAAQQAGGGAALSAAMVSLLGQREVFSGEETDREFRRAILTLSEGMQRRTSVADFTHRPDSWSQELPGQGVSVLTLPSDVNDAAALDRAVNAIVKAAEMGDHPVLLAGKSGVDSQVLNRLKTLLSQQSSSIAKGIGMVLHQRVLDPVNRGGLVDEMGLFSAEGVYKAAGELLFSAGERAKGLKYNVSFLLEDVSQWNRNVSDAELRERIQFLVLDALGAVTQYLPFTEKEMEAIRVLSYQA